MVRGLVRLGAKVWDGHLDGHLGGDFADVSGMFMGCCWDGFGMALGWFGDVLGMFLVWYL